MAAVLRLVGSLAGPGGRGAIGTFLPARDAIGGHRGRNTVRADCRRVSRTEVIAASEHIG
jgi:hypothetical protein